MQSDTREDGAHTYLGAYALCLDNVNRLLLCRLNTGCIEAGYWTLPGGGLDWGEPPEDAVVRELQEGTGLRPGEVSLVGLSTQRCTPTKPRTDLAIQSIMWASSIGFANSQECYGQRPPDLQISVLGSRVRRPSSYRSHRSADSLLALRGRRRTRLARLGDPNHGVVKHRQAQRIRHHEASSERVLHSVPQAPKRLFDHLRGRGSSLPGFPPGEG